MSGPLRVNDFRISSQNSQLDNFNNMIIEKANENLERKVVSNRVFLNMVIHDMRNPSSSIEFAIKEMKKAFN